MKVSLEKKYKIERGCPVEIDEIDHSFTGYPVRGRILIFNCWRSADWTMEGKREFCGVSGQNLVEVPEEFAIKVWINYYHPPKVEFFLCREDADVSACRMRKFNFQRVACLEREIPGEIGEGSIDDCMGES